MTPGHAPVMLQEVLDALRPEPGSRFIDATFGGGGHTTGLLDHSAPDGQVLAVDRDPAAAERVLAIRARLAAPERLLFVQGNFARLGEIARRCDFAAVDGVLFDFGLSSFQLDDPERGFAFRLPGPLDMRMDPASSPSAAEFLATVDEDELVRVLRTWGEEPRARQIARALLRARASDPIETTTRLAEIVETAVGGRRGARIHPATRTFQAIRIAINLEIDAIETGVRDAIGVLKPGGRIATIAFHSLEDRVVKRIIQQESTGCICPPELPVCVCGQTPRLRRIGGSRKPASAEIAHNPRARSAILRVAERLPEVSPHPGEV